MLPRCRLLPGQDHVQLLQDKPALVTMFMCNRRLSMW